jgi:hypothetical protein
VCNDTPFLVFSGLFLDSGAFRRALHFWAVGGLCIAHRSKKPCRVLPPSPLHLILAPCTAHTSGAFRAEHGALAVHPIAVASPASPLPHCRSGCSYLTMSLPPPQRCSLFIRLSKIQKTSALSLRLFTTHVRFLQTPPRKSSSTPVIRFISF